MLIARPVAHHVGRSRGRGPRHGDAGNEPQQPHEQITGHGAENLRIDAFLCRQRLHIQKLRGRIEERPEQKRNPANQLKPIHLHQIEEMILEHHEKQGNAVLGQIHFRVIVLARLTVIKAIKEAHMSSVQAKQSTSPANSASPGSRAASSKSNVDACSGL